MQTFQGLLFVIAFDANWSNSLVRRIQPKGKKATSKSDVSFAQSIHASESLFSTESTVHAFEVSINVRGEV